MIDILSLLLHYVYQGYPLSKRQGERVCINLLQCTDRHAEELPSRSTLGVKELSKEPEVDAGLAKHGMQI